MVKKICLDTASEFLAYIRLASGNWGEELDSSWVFRGHGDAEWPLLPRAWRPGALERFRPGAAGRWRAMAAETWETWRLPVYRNQNRSPDGLTDGLPLVIGGHDFGVSFGIFIYSTYLTSVWIWLYLISGIAVRVMYKVRGMPLFLDQHLKLDEHPLSIMGAMLIVLITIIYWPAVWYWH